MSPVCFTCMATCVLRASYVRTAGWHRSGHRHVGGDGRGLCLGWPDKAQGPGGWDSGQSPGGAQGGTGQLMTAARRGTALHPFPAQAAEPPGSPDRCPQGGGCAPQTPRVRTGRRDGPGVCRGLWDSGPVPPGWPCSCAVAVGLAPGPRGGRVSRQGDRAAGVRSLCRGPGGS